MTLLAPCRKLSVSVRAFARVAQRCTAGIAAAAALLSSTGCGPKRIRADFRGFESAFAETSNREMLLNLARLQNHDPTYFFKMGQITSSYRMNASLTANANYTLQGTVPGGAAPTGGGSPGLIYENDPQFQFIPVNDETNAQLLLKPIPPQTFYILFQQGWRIDQLFRLMVDRIEMTTSGPQGCQVTTYRNNPPFPPRPGQELSAMDQDRLSKYVTFLRVAAIGYGLQKHGDLLLRGVSLFVPNDPKSPVTVGATGLPPTEVEKAAEKNLSYETIGGKVFLGQRVVAPRFFLIPPKAPQGAAYEPDLQAVETDLAQDDDLRSLQQGHVLEGFLSVLRDGFTIEGDVGTQDQDSGPCPPGSSNPSVHLVLRSLIGVMAAAAQEEKLFDEFVQANPALIGPEHAHFNTAVPSVERVPLLRINWKDGHRDQAGAPLTSVSYRGTVYSITDDKDVAIAENQYWNRDVFRLLSALAAQVTVDISKFPVPDILQLRAQ